MKALILAGVLFFSCAASAQTEQTTDNLITSGENHTWTGISTTGALPTDAMPGGPGALYDPNTNTIHFSYGRATVAQTIAINQALAHSGSGIQVQGYTYSWEINNNNYDGRQGGSDTLTANVLTYGPTGALRRNDTWTYNGRFDWTTFSGSVNYTTPGPPSEFGNLRVEFSGVDSGFWNGYFGPQVRNVDVRLRYTVDQCTVDPQSSPSCPGYRTYYNMTDDGYALVNLPFVFPFYGNTFTTSYMFTNGVVGFLSTNLHGYCCDGTDLNQQRFTGDTAWNFAIYALNTDLYPEQHSRFYTQLTDGGTGLKYTWEDVVEFGTNNKNTFHVQIKSTGYIGLSYDKINLSSWSNPLVGIAGDVSLTQYRQVYYGPADQMNLALGADTYTFVGTETTDVCAGNALYDPQCPGYAMAYHDQQCAANALYATTCSGYAAAYYDQQCSINPLYDSGCDNYAIVLAATQPATVQESATTALAQAYTVTAESDTTSPTSVSPASVISVIKPPAAPAAPAPSARSAAREAARAAARAAEQKAEAKKTERAVSRVIPRGATGAAAARAAADAADKAVTDAAMATTIEAQQTAQNAVLGLMGFNPAFSAYQNAMVPDINAAVMARQYNQPTVDNQRALRQLSGASDRVHQDMVDQQYGRMP
jgi:hypothetical protein